MVSCYEKRNLKKSLADGRERPRFDCDYLRDNVEYCGASALWFIPRSTTEPGDDNDLPEHKREGYAERMADQADMRRKEQRENDLLKGQK